jgi:hypothetical protein
MQKRLRGAVARSGKSAAPPGSTARQCNLVLWSSLFKTRFLNVIIISKRLLHGDHISVGSMETLAWTCHFSFLFSKSNQLHYLVLGLILGALMVSAVS